MDDKVFKNDAKNIVDVAFDNRLFKDDLTRDDFNSFEDLLCFMLQSKFETYKRVEALTTRIEQNKLNANK